MRRLVQGFAAIVIPAILVAGCQQSTPPAPSPSTTAATGDVVPPPPPPPPPQPVGITPATPQPGQPAPAGENNAGEALMQELIAVSNQMADEFAKITDAASARAAAPRVGPIVSRHNSLVSRLAAMKITAKPEEFQPLQAKYGEQVRIATQRALTEQARVIGNLEWMSALGQGAMDGAKNGPSPAPAENPASGQGVSLLAACEALTGVCNRISDLLSKVQDEPSARAAQPALKQLASEWEQATRSSLAAMILGRPAEMQSPAFVAAMDNKDQAEQRLDGEIKRIAQGSGGPVLKQDLVYLLQTTVRVAPNDRLRAKAEKMVQEKIQAVGLDK